MLSQADFAYVLTCAMISKGLRDHKAAVETLPHCRRKNATPIPRMGSQVHPPRRREREGSGLKVKGKNILLLPMRIHIIGLAVVRNVRRVAPIGIHHVDIPLETVIPVGHECNLPPIW